MQNLNKVKELLKQFYKKELIKKKSNITLMLKQKARQYNKNTKNLIRYYVNCKSFRKIIIRFNEINIGVLDTIF